MPSILYREALNQALREEMRRDDRVFLMGEEVGYYQGAFKVSKGLLEEFGEKRVIDTPITELGFTGVGVGAAMMGLRPVIEMMTFNFAILAMDQIVNNAVKIQYMSGGQFRVPMVVRGPGGPSRQLAAQHSQSLESWFCHVAGLKVVAPSTPKDAKGLLKSSIRDGNPIIFIEGQELYSQKGEVPEEEYLIPIGQGEIKKEGSDVTLIAWSKMLHLAMDVARDLEQKGVSVEVIDPRTLKPLDVPLLVSSIKKTHRAVIVEEGWRFCGLGAEISSILYGQAFDAFDAPIERVTGIDVPMPYAKNLEKAAIPDKERVMAAIKKTLN
ncbi:MAG: pyruvate dehydrogenase complex E1 component subunit beta [Nitrospirae bacterium]|nr:pyruvate dehydrogenase complex E1 component subunit beta [Nitrospirota bacterium]MBI3352023.1 pyruvate dehydrogenase complex E1 component subunit beta [Nitrospirota bacterium]